MWFPKIKILYPVALLSLSLGLSRAQEREATPAVVDPALRSPLRQTLSLDGQWDFATDPSAIGEQQKWFSPESPLPNKGAIRVPGCWEAQGVGGPGDSTTVTPERSIRPLRGSYAGAAWYRKEGTLPAAWAGKEVWLKIGGVHAQGWFWVNGTYVGHNACYCGTYKYNITDLVKAGERIVIAARVRNDVPSRKGLMGWIERFGGLYRSVELDATAASLIDDAWVAGDLDKTQAVVHVKVRNAGLRPGTPAEVQVTASTLDGTPAGHASTTLKLTEAQVAEIEVPVPMHPFHAWSPETPNLYRADITLKVNGKPIDGWIERFGVRKWEVRGGDFYLNNQRYFIRGFGDDHIYPLTLSSPPSRDVHREHLALAKSYGFAYVRHHTHCEVPEFYDAADEVGIMVQPELPYYGATPSAGATNFFDLKKDLEELYTHYRRYVSFSTYCTGNEGHLGSPIDREVYQFAKKLDPSRLVLHQDGGANHKENSDFHQGPPTPWTPGSQDASWPFDAHEYLNLATDEDPRLAAKYSGAIRPPVTEKDFRAKLEKTGLWWEWGIATLDAGIELQRVYQKRGLEQARLDPASGGYIYWTIVDVGSPSAQGLFTQFWEAKETSADFFHRFDAAAQQKLPLLKVKASQAGLFRQFNDPTVILAKFTPNERILTSGEALGIEWWISAFGNERLKGEGLVWRLQGTNSALVSGKVPPMEIKSGEVKAIGNALFTAPPVNAPAKLKLIGSFPGAAISNSWDVWIFPHRSATPTSDAGLAASPRVFAALKERYPAMTEASTDGAAETGLLLTDALDATATQALARGKSVLLLRLPGIAPGVQLGWWTISPQAGTAIERHPVFGDFPHDGYLNELLSRLLGHTVSAEEPALRQVEPLMVSRGSKGYLTHLFQAKSGNGKLLASGLELLSKNPEAVWLLDQFIRYARSPAFQPRGTFDPANSGPLGKP